MSLTIVAVNENDKKAKKAFVKFPINLYKDCPYYVPSLVLDELGTLDQKKNLFGLPKREDCRSHSSDHQSRSQPHMG